MLGPFVIADVTDEGFEFEMPFPLQPDNYPARDLLGGGAMNVRDTRSGCLTPTLNGTWDQISVIHVNVNTVLISVWGTKSFPSITRGAGEGDCSVDTAVDPAVSEMDGPIFDVPPELRTGETPPAGTLTATTGGWTLTFTTK